ncbi:MAG TPA: hypothetical protein P5081_14795 [Phycisphaerae bacterium]|nr:hypothetical protein [Phycisphaerae bacterium]HRW54137.1 hypothetical protein [Phycisphaerae bacterium]
MKRVAIDFGTNGVRVAETESPDGRISFRRIDVPWTEAGLAAVMEPFAGRPGIELTLRCTHRPFARHSIEHWNAFAAACDCRWFRVAGAPGDTNVTLGVARQLAVEQRRECVAVIDVGDSQASVAVVGHHGALLGHGAWRFFERDLDRIVGVVASCIPDRSLLARVGGVSGPLVVLGIGGAGPDVAGAIVERIDGATQSEHEFSAALPTVGILHADIHRSFECSLPAQPDTLQLRGGFLQLMDNAYDAITREGYDMDDAECVRFVRMETADGEYRDSCVCAMTAEPQQLAEAFRNSVGLRAATPIHFISAHVSATIEPVKPALTGAIVIEAT